MYAYNYAVSKGYDIPRHRNNNRMHMIDLFDMMAGTSTGSILSAGLSIPSRTNSSAPMYYAGEGQEIYMNNAKKIFKSNKLSLFTDILTFMLFLLTFTSIFYCCGKRKYNNPKVHNAHN